MTRRSIFLKNENYADVQSALAKAPDRKRAIWERMKANGCTQESETAFRHHAQTCGFILPDEGRKETTVEPHPIKRAIAGKPFIGLERPGDFDKIYGPKLEK